MGRALAHMTTHVAKFSDPTAFELLSVEERARVERVQSGARPRNVRDWLGLAHLRRLSHMMVARTVEIDDAIRAAGSPQLVVLGAGLDGRAWRMPELRDTIVFEVDHPDSQRDKRARVGSLEQRAREVRFVALDFARGRLDDGLASAGHNPTRPTTWVWEGVVMYLAPPDIEATLSVVDTRSAPSSRLIVAYHSPALVLKLVGLAVRRLGEPLRSAFTADEMRALLARYHFSVVRDEGLSAIGARLASSARSTPVARATRPIKHLRIATADRTS